ncbi:hypothetical protein [Ethanoligenens harbinense]|uniref:SRP54-type proteins GTP-binding domain-containing protein n=1 Tax=Ethanoligenens harbinense (strain DSM 18485 / JCM 12961 / CGMCC 1.5033 / YUAN-3) TaxID=663278 RepID=E6U5S8_ETHHY|nr:hypothetical protein [Ethanoligenens harbinense]ADU27945.1 hypothetical protein Ethha_2450 [Ethanoligenens harbinense YUAN-3]AVQ96973.1 hypothetical protein CXQ68_12585 [Ethanoligenens harbinense YUAN-3]AYF39633.1 hypothetical protein CXP51_12480 [Ethanoligenens harbinense]AYF42461.1 hypothetical protein CN246_13035 [Ethanoligenens harbinense]QCN93214.1 hypothetical protein DRA42_12630 [Ethanoligenens harbinense]
MILIGVIGTPGVGKTTFAAALANILADRNNHVILASLDDHCPAMSLWEPLRHDVPSFKEFIQNDGSIDSEVVYEKVTFSSGNGNVLLFGFTKADLCGSTSVTEKLVDSIVDVVTADNSVDYMVVDGSNYKEAMTSYAISHADVLIRILPADITGGINYFCEVIRGAENASQERLNILYRRNLFDPLDEVVHTTHMDLFDTIPFSDECHRKLVDGRLVSKYDDAEYRHTVERVAVHIRERKQA